MITCLDEGILIGFTSSTTVSATLAPFLGSGFLGSGFLPPLALGSTTNSAFYFLVNLGSFNNSFHKN